MRVIGLLQEGLNLVLPRSCVLCGTGAVLPDAPICSACAASLVPIDGERCPSCGLTLISERGTCMRCRDQDWAFDSIYPLFSYSGSARELITAYKRGGRRTLSSFFARLLASEIEASWSGRVLVPVPPRPGKLRKRGWDQVEEIARRLERAGFPVERPLERRPSEELKGLGRSSRGDNARKAYRLKARSSSPPRPLLIDDVVTTCATIDACARALKEGGALEVAAVVLAAD
jgi:ComF family protein